MICFVASPRFALRQGEGYGAANRRRLGMHVTGWIGLTLGVVMIGAAKMGGPPPVVLELGPLQATPAPTPQRAEKKRLITTITVQNTIEGETVVSFEASDVADEGQGKTHPIATKRYSLAEEKPKLNEAREKILQQVRELEREMLKFAEIAGPPKERIPLQPGEQPGGTRPYR